MESLLDFFGYSINIIIIAMLAALLLFVVAMLMLLVCFDLADVFNNHGVLRGVGACIILVVTIYLIWYNTPPNFSDVPRPAVKIAENYFQECNGSNLYVYKYEDRLSVEPSDIQVVANDASCIGVVK